MVLQTTSTNEAVSDEHRQRILDAAERLFYANGLQQVGMDQVRAESEVSLKRLYREFPSKDQLIEAYLLRRDTRWLSAVTAAAGLGPTDPNARRRVGESREPVERILAVYDWLGEWCAEPGFRGCAFTNSFGELGTRSTMVGDIARAHKNAFRGLFTDLVGELAPKSPSHSGLDVTGLAQQLYLLAEGAITAAAITGEPGAALSAREAARVLLGAAIPGMPDEDPPRSAAPVTGELVRRRLVGLFHLLRRAVQRGAVQRGAVQRGAVQRGAVQRGAVQRRAAASRRHCSRGSS